MIDDGLQRVLICFDGLKLFVILQKEDAAIQAL